MAEKRPQKWIYEHYAQMEYQRKHQPHKITKKEFMKGMTREHGERDRMDQKPTKSDRNLLAGEDEAEDEAAREGSSE